MARRWVVAAAALAAGAAVSGGLLFAADPARGSTEAWAVTRDVPAGMQIDSGSIALARVGPGQGAGLLFTTRDGTALVGLRATHDLLAGQLIQRSDVAASAEPVDRRLVFVPLKDAPPAAAGSRVDLLMLSGLPDHVVVEPFAQNVEVGAAVAGGLVLVVASQQASAFVYAAATVDLVAVVAEPGATGGAELPVTTVQQAVDTAGRT